MSDRDFGRYNCTARNNIGIRYQEFILAQAGESVSSCSTTRLMGFISAPPPHASVQSQESHASKKLQVTVPLLVLRLTVIALFAIHSEINPTTTTAGPLFSLA